MVDDGKPRPLALALTQAREGVVSRLCDAFAQGLLTLAEFEARVEAAEAAQDQNQLSQLIHDLPAPPPAPTHLAVQPKATMLAVFSGLERSGGWQPAQNTDVVCVFGGAELDFRDAVLPPGPTEVHIRCWFGGAQLTVPEGLAVVMEGHGIFGAFHREGGSDRPPSDPQQPWLRVTGKAIFGGVEVRTEKKQKRLS